MELEQDSGKDEGGGAPGWMATFADLMSLLLAFFVLLFSFASVDDNVYKEIGGSMKEAFGVQRREVLMDKVLGVNHIAQEYSSGRPDPNVLNVVPQEHLHVDKPNQVPQEMSENILEKEDSRAEKDYKGEQKSEDASNGKEDDKESQQKASGAATTPDAAKKLAESQAAKQSESTTSKIVENAQNKDISKGGKLDLMKKAAIAMKKLQKVALNKKKKLETTATLKAKNLGEQLAQEIANGELQIETQGTKVIIRLSEEASFLPGSSQTIAPFEPLVGKISQAIKDSPGKISVAGHTDSSPVTSNSMYRSNWDLSSARAVTVVEGIIQGTGLPRSRFEVTGHADTKPIATNETPEGRSKNRRVEIVLQYDSKDMVPNELKNQVPEEEEQLKELIEEMDVIEKSEFEKALDAIIANGDSDDGKFDKIFQNDFFQQ